MLSRSLPWTFWGARSSLLPASVPAPRSRPGATLVLLLFLLLVLLLWGSGTRLDVEHCYTLLTLRLKKYEKYSLDVVTSNYLTLLGHIRRRYQHVRRIHIFFCHPNSLSHAGLIKSKEAEIKLGKMLHVYQKVKNSLTKAKKHDAVLMQFWCSFDAILIFHKIY